MRKGRKDPAIDRFLGKAGKWRAEMGRLRDAIMDCDVTEGLKWGKPCYSFQGRNIVVIQGFKSYCAVLFFKGVLLKDPDGILVKTGENTRVGRQLRFTRIQEIAEMEAVLKAFVDQAIAVEEAGLKVPAVTGAKTSLPAELYKAFDVDPRLKTAFDALTPGRQRGYAYYFSGAKQSKTRESRIAKCVAQILAGKGLND